MTPEELMAVHAKMTPGEWRREGIDEVFCGHDGENSPTFLAFGANQLNNTDGIVALHNHFPAFMRRYEEMRAALEAVQWNALGDNGWECPDCGRTCPSGHREDCRVGTALANANKPLEVA
jgi:hypothetical protein